MDLFQFLQLMHPKDFFLHQTQFQIFEQLKENFSLIYQYFNFMVKRLSSYQFRKYLKINFENQSFNLKN